MTIALAQHRVKASRVGANVDRAVAAIERAAADGADLVCLPELFNVGYFAFESYARNAEGLDGPTLDRIRDVAADHGVAVQAGSIVEDLEASAAAGFETPAPDGLANASAFVGRDGEVEAVYRKQHLFGYDSAETELLTPGESLSTVEFEGFTVGMTTCYDLRFPELYRDLADEGVSLILVPSAWPYPRVEHWQTLPRSRAIENLAYVATVNGAGEMEGDRLVGRSTVYDPWGTPQATCDDDPALVTTEIAPSQVEAVREEFPALRDRR
ncbi:nitrilase-related carbon-nitrogen hydrolase [Halolamina litorea]|uniref:Nitrilase-related carbon-nitrogen hydrolase n=1 Tax=Halolamina litorea TaxID=1515593 RepID=A0ABD6BR23_9EURY